MSSFLFQSDIEEIRNDLANLANDLSGKTILLTGGRGFLGRYFMEIFNSFNKVTQSLQARVLDVRMVPVSRLFGRVPRILRDICKELDKEVNLEIHFLKEFFVISTKFIIEFYIKHRLINFFQS